MSLPRAKGSGLRRAKLLARAVGLLLFAFVAAVLLRCVPAPDLDGARLLDTFPTVALEWKGEWRVARRVPAGDTAVALGLAPGDGLLRFGVPHGLYAAPPTFEAYVEEKRLSPLAGRRGRGWLDYRISLAGTAPNTPVFLRVHSEHEVLLGPCEVVDTGRSPTPPNVLIFLIDALRLDHVGCYGYPKKTTPRIDQFAEGAVLFEGLTPQSSWTRPSVASLLTGTYPATHGARDKMDVLREGLPNLADALRRHGYETHFYNSNVNLMPAWGFGRGFDRFVDLDSMNWAERDDAEVVDSVISGLESVAGRPWFFYVHTMGPHDPYAPPPGYAERFVDPGSREDERAATVAKYDGEIAYTDAQFGRLVEALKAKGLFDNTVILVLSDHGEEFWEHGALGHGQSLYEEVLRIPFLLRLPKALHAGTRIPGLLEVVDIAPSLLDFLALPPESGFEGRSFLDKTGTVPSERVPEGDGTVPVLSSERVPEGDGTVPVLSSERVFEGDGTVPERLLGRDGTVPISSPASSRTAYASLTYKNLSMRAAKRDTHKYLKDVVAGREQWFDLAIDPGEAQRRDHPFTQSAPLKRHAQRMAVKGEAGLHLLMTCGSEKRVLRGTISAPGQGACDIHYPEWKTQLQKLDGALSFELATHASADALRGLDVWHGQIAEQAHAHLRVAVPPDAPITIELTASPRPLSPDTVLLGARDSGLRLEDGSFEAAQLLAPPDAYDPAALPARFAVYVWYVPPPAALDSARFTPGMKEAMDGLGYL